MKHAGTPSLQVFQQRQAVIAYASERDIPTLSADGCWLVANTLKVLQHFVEITKQTSVENKVISLIIPGVLTLRLCLSKRNTDVGVQILKSQLGESLERRFISASFHLHLNSTNLTLATLFDPRYKSRSAQKWSGKF